MHVYLIQHGKPVPKEDDPERPLSEQGENDVKKMAHFLQKYGLNVDRIFHSGKTRAKQTAEIMASVLMPGKGAKEKRGLSPLDHVHSIANEIKESEEDLMIIGHLPHLARLTSLLIAGTESATIVEFQQGGVVCLKRKEEGDWTITWMLPPDLIA